ncbi:hypothetical protein A3844_23100 [Paenibacillus helianthi]|uniref:DUF1129 domain-containing protein n=1 Tax=Paenibacillus helianthi TaxID=1349432 RepID=A0ABX3EHU0_9BACL|nr:DUF1129 family protein [Paenibacillus helianthi]OKP82859.1 hypothetical protein A3844_23100 [Paenibacillus helianthi]
MKVKAMIKQNNVLREQMTPFNRSYYEDMLLALRASKVDPVRTEQLLLEAAALLLEGQGKGKNAKQIFGEHPEDYFKEITGSVSTPKVRSKLNHYLMISCAALTGLFSVYAIAGLLLLWSTGEAGLFGRISIFTILVVGAGAIVLMEMIMRWMSSLSEDDAPKPKAFDIKALGIYVGIAILVVFLGVFLDNLFPVISISPWVSLVLAVAGGLGLKLVFFRS